MGSGLFAAFVAACTLTLFGDQGDALRILIMSPSLSKSIVQSSGRMADALVLAGHNVTFWIPEMNKRNVINGTTLARIVRTNGHSDRFEKFVEGAVDYFDDSMDFVSMRRIEHDALTHFCESIVKRRKDLDKLFGSGQFDVAASTMIDVCWPGLAAYLRIPQFVWISTGPLIDIYTMLLGIPQPSSYVPSTLDNALGSRMNFRQRAVNTAMYLVGYVMWHQLIQEETRVFRCYISPDFRNLGELAARSDFSVVFAHSFVEHVRPITSVIESVGMTGISRPKSFSLPRAVDNVLSTNRKGRDMILFSLGSAIPTHLINRESISAIFDTFRSLPEYFFLMKISEADEFSQKLAVDVENVYVSTWLPQLDLLGHPNMRLFITHGGYNSVYEASACGIPMIGLPVFFDQFYDIELMVERGYGLSLQRSLLTSSLLRDTILKILQNSRFAENARKISDFLETYIEWSPPSERISKRMEFAARHPHYVNRFSMKAAINSISFTHYGLDLILIILALVVLLTIS